MWTQEIEQLASPGAQIERRQIVARRRSPPVLEFDPADCAEIHLERRPEGRRLSRQHLPALRNLRGRPTRLFTHELVEPHGTVREAAAHRLLLLERSVAVLGVVA